MKKNLYSSYEKREEEKESKSGPHSKIKKEEIERNEIINIRVVREALAALNSGDISNVEEFISPQYFNHESQMDPIRSKLRGPEEFIDTVRNLRSAFADLHYEEQEIVASKDKVISILNVTGKHVGNFFVIPPTGNDIRYRAVHIHTIGNDGKIVKHMAIRDDLTQNTTSSSKLGRVLHNHIFPSSKPQNNPLIMKKQKYVLFIFR
jgi:predicted ester cyclase